MDLAYKIMNQKDYPSYGWWIEQGATTTWEEWCGDNSRNHPMFGGGLGWYYRDLAGLRCKQAGFKSFDIRPVVPEGLEWVEYTHDTTYGEIAIRWEHKESEFKLECTIPVGATATVWMPTASGYQPYEVLSGNHTFTSKL